MSRAFRHVKVDPADYDLLSLHWQDEDFIDTCVPFGSRHGMQIFQSLSDAVRYIFTTKGYQVINYVNDFIGVGTPTMPKISFNCLYTLLQDLGFTI